MYKNEVAVHRLVEKASKMAEKHPKGTVLGQLKREMISSLDVSTLTGKHETLGRKLKELDNVKPISSCLII